MLVIKIIVCAGMWAVAALLFEALVAPLYLTRPIAPKGKYCRVWWIALAMMSYLHGGDIFPCSILVMGVIALSHMNLCDRGSATVSLMAILRNMPSTFRTLWSRLQNFAHSVK